MDTGDRSTYESVCISSITFPWTHGDGGLHRAPSTRPSLPQPGPLGKGPPDVSAKLAWGCWEQGLSHTEAHYITLREDHVIH